MSGDDWAKRVPDGLIAMRAHVWWCGDYECDCTQARIEGATSRVASGAPAFDLRLWEGTFRSGWAYEYEWDVDAGAGPTTELNREARRLRKQHNALYHQIEWPWDRERMIAERKREYDEALTRVRRARSTDERNAAARDVFIVSIRNLLGRLP